jgi:DNA invertase Pin-like site-specific DNA recombinase
MTEVAQSEFRYCLYARKSTESEEMQVLSIDSQIKEMLQIAERDNLTIVEIKKESHSAKEAGTRPVFNELVTNIHDGKFNAILTWAPDRISRNAGDLGRVVDLMDAGMLHEIRTYGQKFSNSPNEKFLLMILGSQAKLENDNKVQNVKRGLRARCEMGHAIHSERIKTQPTLYQGYSTATAETASTLFEHIAMAEIEAEATDNERLILLNNRLEDAIGTTFRQIACFNFEREMHETIRAKGAVSKDELAAMMQKHLATYLGPAVTVTRDDGYAFASWPHIRYGFYVYTYAYGFLVSQALFSRYRKNHSFIKKIDEFLCAGESDFVENIFKKIGINLRTKKFWEDGLRAIEEDVKEFERLVRTKKR